MGQIVGEIIIEMLAMAYKLKALILSFGERSLKLVSKLGVPIIRATSTLKEDIKRRGKIRRALRISGYALSFDVVRILTAQLGLSLLPFQKDIGLGLILVADG